MKVIKQMLDRLIPTDDKHTVLLEQNTYDIEVLPGSLMTYRIPVKHAIPPVYVFIRYNDQEEGFRSRRTRIIPRDLKVYVD